MPFVTHRRLQSMQAAIRYKDQLCSKYLSMVVNLAETNGDLSQKLELLEQENRALRTTLAETVREVIA